MNPFHLSHQTQHILGIIGIILAISLVLAIIGLRVYLGYLERRQRPWKRNRR